MVKITIQTVISIIAAFISLSTVIVSIYYNHKNSKQYLKSLDPLLSFKLFELKDELYLDALFGKEIELYPNESTQGRIAFWGATICSSAFPKINIDIRYKKGVTGEQVHIERTVIFSPSYDEKIYGDFNIDLRELNKNMDVMAKANLRTANYLDGCQVAPFDELNILAHKSLHDDLQSVKQGENVSTVMKREDVIKNRL